MKSLAGLVALFSLSASAAPTSIDWRVENPYPLFRDPAVVSQLQPKNGEAPSAWYRRSVGNGPINWPRHHETAWDPESERFRLGYLDVPSSHRVVAQLTNRIEGQCVWRTEQSEHIAACDREAIINVPYPAGTELSVALPNGTVLKASQRVQVEELIVLGLGDSYGSGEGNPDHPARYVMPNGASWRRIAKSGLKWISRPDVLAAKAEWLDYRCHRSLYSNQNMVALWLSAQKHNRVVRFVPFACSGAVTSEMNVKAQSSLAETEAGTHPRPLRHPQLIAARSALEGSQGYRFPSLVLLSLGGNDALFGPTISQVLVPARGRWPWTTPGQWLIRRLLGFSTSSADGEYVIKNELASSYLDVMTDLRTRLELGPSTQVLWTTYADPLQRETGEACALPSPDNCASEYATGDDQLCRNSAFQVMRLMDGPTTILANPGIVSFEVEDVRSRFITPIQRQIRKSHADIEMRWQQINGPQLTLVEEPEDMGSRHGICAVEAANSEHPEDELRWPIPLRDGSWRGMSPVAYEPYITRNRWFRTANESVLIQNRSQKGVIKGWGPRVRGMFHPTAEYHAHLADAVVCALKPELGKQPRFCPTRPIAINRSTNSDSLGAP